MRDINAPQGGWKYTCVTGTTLHAQFFKILWRDVQLHYAANGLQPPDRAEVEDGACRETNPGASFCGAKRKKIIDRMLPFLTLTVAERFVRSVWGALKDRRLVPRAEAERRHAICMECPLSTELGLCMGCTGFLRLVEKALKNNPIPSVPKKDTCGACGCRLNLKCWIENDTLDKAEKTRPAYHESCWRLEANRGAEIKTESST